MIRSLAFMAALGATSPGEAAAPTLSALEHHVDAYYEGASQALREGRSCLEEDQRRWRAIVKRECTDDGCRGSAYMDRLGELHALQPGVTAIRHFTLPRRPQLVWIVPPVADKVAAPRQARAMPAQVEGTVLDEIANGDGFVLRTAAGERYLLVAAMFLEGSSAQRLSLIIQEQERGARFIARGHLVPGKRAAKAFEPSRCLFLHRRMP